MCGNYSKTKSEIMKHYEKYHVIFFIPNHRSWDFKPFLQKAKPTSLDSSSDKPKAPIRSVGYQPLDFSQTRVLIDQAAAWFWSGSSLINQAAAWFWSGMCLTDQAAAWFWSGSSLNPDRSGCCLILIWHVPDRSGSCLILIRQQPDRSGCRLIWSGICLIDQAAAWYQAAWYQAVPAFEICIVPAVKLVVFR